MDFIDTLIEDLTAYFTLPTFTLRRLRRVEMAKGHAERLPDFIKELDTIKGFLGPDYLERIKARAAKLHDEVIIAVEHQAQ